MIVAVALLMLVMGMASTVFKVTLEGSGRLQQLSEIDRSIRMFKNTLARELGAIDPQRSVLAIQGNVTPAYWTHEQYRAGNGLAAGGTCLTGDGNPRNGPECDRVDYPRDPDRENPTLGYAPTEPGGAVTAAFDPEPADDHDPALPRADILMFVTNLPEARSFVNPAVRSDGPVMIVYNHAEQLNNEDRWRLIPTLTRPANGQPDLKDWQAVASDWHLARRAILLKEAPDANDMLAAHVLSPTNPAGNHYLQDDAIYNGVYEGLATPANVQPAEWTSLKKVAQGQVDYVLPCTDQAPGDCPGIQDFIFRYEVPDRFFGPDTASLDWQRFDGNADGVVDIEFAGKDFTINGGNKFRRGLPAFWLMRSHLDPTPTAANASSLSQYFLPHCASFKVEWTPNEIRLDHAGLTEVVWIDAFKEPDMLAVPLTAVIPKPAHLCEFDIVAQKMSPAPGVGLANHPVWGNNGSYPASPLLEGRQPLLPRFALGGVSPLQMNVYDSNAGTDPVEPSFNTHVWFARDLAITTNPQTGQLAPATLDQVDPLWPRALRITIDLFDDTGQFQTPVRHTFILPVGAQGDPKRKLS
jgi:hypothetical protein